jgi:hypothetical protein
MSILSLQAIIQKYGANFGIDPKSALKVPAQASAKGTPAAGNPAAGSASGQNAQPPAAGKVPSADSVNLSPAAKDFLAAHTGPLGQFEVPNMMDAFFGALDGTDGDGNGNATGNSLLDFLSGPDSGNPGGSGQSQDPFGFTNPFGAGNSPSKSLTDFL